jgi:hypothetical protein
VARHALVAMIAAIEVDLVGHWIVFLEHDRTSNGHDRRKAQIATFSQAQVFSRLAIFCRYTIVSSAP